MVVLCPAFLCRFFSELELTFWRPSAVLLGTAKPSPLKIYALSSLKSSIWALMRHIDRLSLAVPLVVRVVGKQRATRVRVPDIEVEHVKKTPAWNRTDSPVTRAKTAGGRHKLPDAAMPDRLRVLVKCTTFVHVVGCSNTFLFRFSNLGKVWNPIFCPGNYIQLGVERRRIGKAQATAMPVQAATHPSVAERQRSAKVVVAVSRYEWPEVAPCSVGKPETVV
jgi:hypothetical protein